MDESGIMVIEDFEITLPWPPSVNHYWRRCGNRYFVSQEGRNYRDTVIGRCRENKVRYPKENKLKLSIDAFPPDRRRRDLDNVLKSLLDSLQHAKVYEDDYQIDQLSVIRNQEIIGLVLVKISVINY
jgi:crossover junction endodeoxyribonuclease RusA